VEVCPVDCISLDTDNPESRQDLELKNKQILQQKQDELN
jgi:formate hydrogenlyase subunit 6/NADH:ubiquinone oxidoreductase subunit I